jgi:predicted nucleotidyltransferase
MNIQALLTHLQNHLPDVLAVYLFGSHAQGNPWIGLQKYRRA